MKYSIIVPFYGVEDWIDKCLISIEQQIFSPEEYEVILIDDVSSDKSNQIAKKYISKNNNWKLIEHENNLGLGGARNTGIKNSCGKYILFVDSDDWIDKNMLKILDEFYDQYEMLVFGYKIKLKAEEYEKKFLENNNLLLQIPPATWLKLYKSSLFDTIKFSEKIYYEDTEIWPLLVDKVTKWKIIPDVLYNYNKMNENSIMSKITNNQKKIDDYFNIFENTDKKIINCNKINLIEYNAFKYKTYNYLRQMANKEKYNKTFEIENKIDKQMSNIKISTQQLNEYIFEKNNEIKNNEIKNLEQIKKSNELIEKLNQKVEKMRLKNRIMFWKN